MGLVRKPGISKSIMVGVIFDVPMLVGYSLCWTIVVILVIVIVDFPI